jgi:hypothetical protein
MVGSILTGRHARDERQRGPLRGRVPGAVRCRVRHDLAAAALYGLVLPVMELSQARHAARAGAAAVTYTLVIEMQLVIGLTATVFSAVGMLANNDLHASSFSLPTFLLQVFRKKKTFLLQVVHALTMIPGLPDIPALSTPSLFVCLCNHHTTAATATLSVKLTENRKPNRNNCN